MESLSGKVRIVVKAGADRNEILGYDKEKDAYRVMVRAPAQDNKANIEIVKFFSKLSKKKVRILSGFRSKLKTLFFE